MSIKCFLLFMHFFRLTIYMAQRMVASSLKESREKKVLRATFEIAFFSKGKKKTSNKRRAWTIIITNANTIHLTYAIYDCAIWHSFISIVACSIKSIYDSLSVANWKETVYPWHNRRMHSTEVHQDTSVRSSQNDMIGLRATKSTE